MADKQSEKDYLIKLVWAGWGTHAYKNCFAQAYNPCLLYKL